MDIPIDGFRGFAPQNVQVGGDHYKKHMIQPIEFIMANKLDYCQGNAIKYIVRHHDKNGREDLEKAKHYIDLMIDHYYGGEDEEGATEKPGC